MRYLHASVKNVVREKKRSFLLAGAIGFGLTVIILVGSLADGIMDSFINQQAGMISGHVVARGYRYNAGDSLISAFSEEDPLLGISRSFFSEEDRINRRSTAMGTFINGSEARQQMVMGIDPAEESYLKELLYLQEGDFLHESEEQGILLAGIIAEDLGLKIGDSVMLKTRTVDGVNNVGDFIVRGIIADDLGTISNMASFVNRSYLNQVIGLESGGYTELHVFLEDNSATEEAAVSFWDHLSRGNYPVVQRPADRRERQEILARLSSEDWQGVRYQISSLEETFEQVYVIGAFFNGTSLIIMIVLMAIILVGISNTLRMMTFERKKEIGTMRALGMQRRAVVRSFIVEMMIIALLGVLFGSIAALGLGWVIHSIKIDAGHTFMSMFLYRGHLTLSFLPVRFFFSGAVILILVWLGSLLPAGRAAKVDPAKAIHSIS